MAKISFEIKQQMVGLAGACFWYWNSYHSFLASCGVPATLYERYPKDAYNKYAVMRNVLAELEEADEANTIQQIVSNFYRLRNAVDRDKLDTDRAKRLLEEFRDTVGNDPIESELKRRQQEAARAEYRAVVDNVVQQASTLESLNTRLMSLFSATDISPQQRGYRLEDLFFDLLHHCEIDHSRPYRTPDGEQIDGHFQFVKFDYLVEVKWEKEPTKQKDLSIFDGKIRGKAQSTRGLFLAAEGFDPNAISKFSGDAPRILLMTGEDLALVLNGTWPLADVLQAKIDAIVRYGNIHFQARDIKR